MRKFPHPATKGSPPWTPPLSNMLARNPGKSRLNIALARGSNPPRSRGASTSIMNQVRNAKTKPTNSDPMSRSLSGAIFTYDSAHKIMKLNRTRPDGWGLCGGRCSDQTRKRTEVLRAKAALPSTALRAGRMTILVGSSRRVAARSTPGSVPLEIRAEILRAAKEERGA
jgi:hypothetical protein